MTYLLPLFLALSMLGCASIKNITNPLKDDEPKKSLEEKNTTTKPANADVSEAELYFYRQTDILTIGQTVELYVNDDEIGELGHSESLFKKVPIGKYELITKVGLSISIPVTGFGGACKFAKDFPLVDATHYFKIKFSPGIFCGEHEVIEISESEYKKLKEK